MLWLKLLPAVASAPPTFEIAPLTRHAEGAVLHVTDVNPSRYLVDELGIVRCTMDRRAYVAVHQWNRAPPPTSSPPRPSSQKIARL